MNIVSIGPPNIACNFSQGIAKTWSLPDGTFRRPRWRARWEARRIPEFNHFRLRYTSRMLSLATKGLDPLIWMMRTTGWNLWKESANRSRPSNRFAPGLHGLDIRQDVGDARS